MTMTAARVREILGSHGGDAARWPADERDAVTAAPAADRSLRATAAEARALDGLLDGWARRDLSGGADAEAAAARVLRPARPWRRWALGSGLAAAAAGLLVMISPMSMTPAPRAAVVVADPGLLTDEAAFASLFTPTPDEENLI